MIIPWTIGQQYTDADAALTAVTSCGMLARAQYGVAMLLDSHARFADGRVPVVIDQVGDYVSELGALTQKALGLIWLVQAPEMERQRATEWLLTLTAQAIETPAINRNLRGECLTASRACEMGLAILEGQSPCAGFSPLRINRFVKVQSDPQTCSYALVMQTRTMVTVVTKSPETV